MRENPLIKSANSERHGACCANQRCLVCGAHVSTYNANQPLSVERPEADGWDWWAACDNADCEHAYGEGVFQSNPEWVERDEAPVVEVVRATPSTLRTATNG